MNDWKPYRNPDDGRTGWISPGGKVVYGDKPGGADQESPEPGSSGVSSQLAAFKADPSKVTHAGLKQLVGQLKQMTPEQRKQALGGQQQAPQKSPEPMENVKEQPDANQEAPGKAYDATDGYLNEYIQSHPHTWRENLPKVKQNLDRIAESHPSVFRSEMKLRTPWEQKYLVAKRELLKSAKKKKLQMPGKVSIPSADAEEFLGLLKDAGAERQGKTWKVRYSRLACLADYIDDHPHVKGPSWTFDLEPVPDHEEPKRDPEEATDIIEAMGEAVKLQRRRYSKQIEEQQETHRSELRELVAAIKAQSERPINVVINSPEIKIPEIVIPPMPAMPEFRPTLELKPTFNVPKADPVEVKVTLPEAREPEKFDILPVRDEDGKIARFKRVPVK